MKQEFAGKVTYLKILLIWCHVDTIGNENTYLFHFGLLFRLYCNFLFMNNLEESNCCQAESTENLDGLLDEGGEVIFWELHAIKGLLLTNIQYNRLPSMSQLSKFARNAFISFKIFVVCMSFRLAN